MKKSARKTLEKELHTAIEKVLKENGATIKNKTEKTVNKSIIKIAKKTDLKATVSKKKK